MKTTVLLIQNKLGKHIHFGNGNQKKFIELIIYGSNAPYIFGKKGKIFKNVSNIFANQNVTLVCTN